MEKKAQLHSKGEPGNNSANTQSRSNRIRVYECDENSDHPHFQLEQMREFRYTLTGRYNEPLSVSALMKVSGLSICGPMVQSLVNGDRTTGHGSNNDSDACLAHFTSTYYERLIS